MTYLVRLRRTDLRPRRGEPAEHAEQVVSACDATDARFRCVVPSYGLWRIESVSAVRTPGTTPANP